MAFWRRICLLQCLSHFLMALLYGGKMWNVCHGRNQKIEAHGTGCHFCVEFFMGFLNEI